MFHKEGYTIITVSFIIIAIINLLSVNFIDNEIITKSIGSITIIVLVLILQFFRNPKRITPKNLRTASKPPGPSRRSIKFKDFNTI